MEKLDMINIYIFWGVLGIQNRVNIKQKKERNN